jgi:acetyl-CoA C-acetyltransferase
MLSRSSSSISRRFYSVLSSPSPRDVVIVSAVRTPVGLFNGGLAALSATQLGAAVVKAAVTRAGIKNEDVDEVIMGNVVSAGIGQAPARQSAKFAGLPDKTICTRPTPNNNTAFAL